MVLVSGWVMLLGMKGVDSVCGTEGGLLGGAGGRDRIAAETREIQTRMTILMARRKPKSVIELMVVQVHALRKCIIKSSRFASTAVFTI